jgi:hypothetical protein
MTTEEPAAPTPPEAPTAAPAAAAPAAPTAPAETSGSGSASISPGQVLAGIGAIATVVSIFLNWADVTGPGGTATLKGTDVPLQFLWDKGTQSTDPSLILPLVVAAVLIGVGLLLPTARLAVFIGGGLAIAVSALYCVQVQRGLDAGLGDRLNITLTDFISIGVYLAFAGGVLAIVGALTPRKN